MRSIFIILLAACFCFAQRNPGVINGTTSLQPYSGDEALRSMAGLYQLRMLNISHDSANVKVTTAYGSGRLLHSIYNNASTVATVRFRISNDTAHITMKIPAYTRSYEVPAIDSIYWSGTSDSLILNFRRW